MTIAWKRELVRVPEVSVVVPVRDNAPGIQSCLAGLARQGVPLEVIVVDDGSRDGSGDAARVTGACVLEAGANGAAAARNAGLRAARGEIVLFTDSDCIPCPGWARSLVEPLAERGVVATKGCYRTRQEQVTARFVQLEYEERYRRMQELDTIDFLDTYSLGVRRADLLAIGGFDAALPGASVEDQEMSFRLAERGRFRFAPGAVVEHRHAASPIGYAKKKLRIGRGKATLLRRHPRRIRGDSHTPDGLRFQVGALLLALLLAPIGVVSGSVRLLVLALALSPILFSASLVRDSVRRYGYGALGWGAGLVLVRGWALAIGFAWGLVSPLAHLEMRPLPPIPPSPSPAGADGSESEPARERHDVVDTLS